MSVAHLPLLLKVKHALSVRNALQRQQETFKKIQTLNVFELVFFQVYPEVISAGPKMGAHSVWRRVFLGHFPWGGNK